MGVFRLPWVSEEWLWQCPFNYCDHFGDKEVLAKICTICKEDLAREAEYQKLDDELAKQEAVFDNLEDALEHASALLGREVKEDPKTGEIVSKQPQIREPEEEYPLYQVAHQYGREIHTVIMKLINSNQFGENKMLSAAIDVLMHSENYVAVKISRAVFSRAEEVKMAIDELDDSKTSAFFAYAALERNAKALDALANQQPPLSTLTEYDHLAELSHKLATMIRDDFFAETDMNFEEYGCESYNNLFQAHNAA